LFGFFVVAGVGVVCAGFWGCVSFSGLLVWLCCETIPEVSDPKGFKHFYVFRHGETDWNAEGRFQGHIDIPLNDRGREQARGLIPRLEPYGLQAILSSDLSRAHETARIVAAGLDIPVFMDEGLREAFLGQAQGMTYEEILRQFGDDVAGRWRSDHPTDADVSYPGGESANQVMVRVFEAITRFASRETSFTHIGVSCHGGVIRRIMQRIRPPGSEPVRIPNAVLYRISYESKTDAWSVLAD
jgi:probable phosphoglycerate mutase